MHDADTRKQTFDSAFAERVLRADPDSRSWAVNKDFEIIFHERGGRPRAFGPRTGKKSMAGHC